MARAGKVDDKRLLSICISLQIILAQLTEAAHNLELMLKELRDEYNKESTK